MGMISGISKTFSKEKLLKKITGKFNLPLKNKVKKLKCSVKDDK
jgi:hypothetical protein